MPTIQRNFIYPLLVIIIGVLLLLVAVNILPAAVGDLIQRSWAVLLVLAGIDFLLRGRLPFTQRAPQVSTLIALIVAGAILGVMVSYAYTERMDEVRSENVEVLEPIPLGEHIQGVQVNVEALNATVVFQPTPQLERIIAARYSGSNASDVRISVQEDENGIVNLNIVEARAEGMPKLEDVGRGELVITLPVGVLIDNPSDERPGLTFTNERGLVTLDFQALDIPRFDIRNKSGDIDLYMPIDGIVIGDVNIDEGNLLVVIDPNISLRVSNTPDNNNIEWNENVYSALVNRVIESRGGLESFQMNLRVNLPRGTLTIMSPEERAAQQGAE